jgi:hypothetical protein
MAFDHAPVGLTQCPRGITALNPALEHMLGDRLFDGRSPYFGDLVHPEEKATVERLMQETFDGKRESFQIDSKNPSCGLGMSVLDVPSPAAERIRSTPSRANCGCACK